MAQCRNWVLQLTQAYLGEGSIAQHSPKEVARGSVLCSPRNGLRANGVIILTEQQSRELLSFYNGIYLVMVERF